MIRIARGMFFVRSDYGSNLVSMRKVITLLARFVVGSARGRENRYICSRNRYHELAEHHSVRDRRGRIYVARQSRDPRHACPQILQMRRVRRFGMPLSHE